MTDLDRFVELYQTLGIQLNVVKTDDGSKVILTTFTDDEDIERKKDITTSKKFEGYDGFYSNIDFDKDGKFIKQGFWE